MTVATTTRRGTAWHRLRRNRLSFAGVLVLSGVVITVIVGPLLWRVDPIAIDLANRLAAPSALHPLGTDIQGRDLLARILHGGRVTLFVAVASVVVALVFGSGAGLLSGFVRGWFDTAVMRVADVLLAFPPLLLALVIAAARGPGVANTILAVSIPALPRFARLMRAQSLAIREREYVLAAWAVGLSPLRILFRHVLPNAVGPVTVQASIAAGIAVLEVAGLGFLGLGVQPPSPELGAILVDSQTYLLQQPTAVLAPGIVISLSILGFNLLGDALGDVFDVGSGS
ncbi:MAG TPA: ABC transporter permease [Actinobacteria bacterium]|nr:ABC transporter permease [Actinomycetota bacterium]